MFGITGKHLEPIDRLAKTLYSDYDTEKLGTWAILYLCCGAMSGGNSLWHHIVKNSDIFVCSSDLAKFIQGEKVCTSDDYAIRFSECIKEWNNSSYAIALAEKRMEKYSGKISDAALLCHKTWLTLAIMLNSLQDIHREELLGFNCQKWVSVSNSEAQNYGWPTLFFVAGILLTAEPSVEWHKMASAIHGMNKPYKEDVAALFEHYAGKNLLSKSGSG